MSFTRRRTSLNGAQVDHFTVRKKCEIGGFHCFLGYLTNEQRARGLMKNEMTHTKSQWRPKRSRVKQGTRFHELCIRNERADQ